MAARPHLDDKKVAAARLWAAHQFPYLAAALFASKLVAVPRLGTVAVDEAWRLYVDPVLVESMAADELGTILVHHAGHLLRDHAGRARTLGIGGRFAGLAGHDELFSKWTLAADMEINDDLAETGLPLADEAILPDQLGCEPNKLAEEYFHELRACQTPCPECGSGAHAQPRDWEMLDEAAALSPNAAHLLRCQVASEILKCRGTGIGHVPGGWERWARELLEPKVDWRKALAAELRQGVQAVAGAVDYTYRRPSRRARAAGKVVLPSLQKPLPEVAVVCDTSGSMSDDLLGQVLAEVEGLLRSIGLRRDRLRVLACDADVHLVQRVSSAKQVTLAGGGGTNMGVGIAAATALKPPPNVVVVLTDGLTPWPSDPPPKTTVVVGLLRPDAPEPPVWARIVRVEDEG